MPRISTVNFKLFDYFIIPCGSKKNVGVTKAEEMYKGSYFRKNLRVALSMTDRSKILILSTKYGLISLDEIIEHYSEYLQWSSSKSKKERFYQRLLESKPDFNGNIYSFCSSIYDGFLKYVYGDSITITNFHCSEDLLGRRLIKLNKYLEELDAKESFIIR